ncbi:carbonic anhydrase 1-like isoform X1 [Choristoneura fumiferana]|uniref:carbonic anhydrase 1-like isoform X1 n=1 Tax=Choristoneura fumiferana TaxID=7141 RepID=UPI003D1553DF
MILLFSLIVGATGILPSPTVRPAFAPMWRYDDETTWPGTLCHSGQRQSPINIRTAAVEMDFDRRFIRNGKLQLSGYNGVLVSGQNNGHTIQFTMEGDEAMHPTLTGGPLKHLYRLEQLHFHWLSEHAVDGFKYPMEIHFVHIRTDLSVAGALDVKDGLAIIAVFCNIHPEAEIADPKSDMEEVMHEVPKLKTLGSRVSGVILDMTRLLKTPQNYVTYSGSLTSPECNEAVTWIILEDPIFMTDAQYRLFSDIGVGRHNFRSLQASNRSLWRPPRARFYTPYLVQVLHELLSTAASFVRNITGCDMVEETKKAM